MLDFTDQYGYNGTNVLGGGKTSMPKKTLTRLFCALDADDQDLMIKMAGRLAHVCPLEIERMLAVLHDRSPTVAQIDA